MKAKKNLAFRLLATLPKEEHGKFLDFVNWYKSEILEFTKFLIYNDILSDTELKDHNKFAESTLRVYKTKLKDTLLEYRSIIGADENLDYLRKISHVRSLNLLGEDFLGNARVEVNRILRTISPYTKIAYEIILYTELSMAMKGFSEDILAEVADAAQKGAERCRDMQYILETYSYYVQTTSLMQQFVVLRSPEAKAKYEELCNHPARFLKFSDIKESPIRFFWLLSNQHLEFFQEDLDLYLHYAKKLYEISIENIGMFNETIHTATFIAKIDLFNAYLHSRKYEKAKDEVLILKKLIQKIPIQESIHMYAELYEKEILLQIQGIDVGTHESEFVKLLRTRTDLFTLDIQRLYKFTLIKFYLFDGKFDKASLMANEIVSEKAKGGLTRSEVEVTFLLILIIQISKIIRLKEDGKSEANDFYYLNALLTSYKEKIRKSKEEYQLELLFVKSFSAFSFTTSLKDMKLKLKELYTDIKTKESVKNIYYQTQFKRIFDYDKWFELLI